MPDEKQPEDADIENQLHSMQNDNLTGQLAKFPPIQDDRQKDSKQNLDLILDIDVEVTAELGRTSMLIKDIIELSPGSVIELNKLAGESVDIFINQALVAKGEVVVINENFGVRITEIVGAAARIQNLGKQKEA